MPPHPALKKCEILTETDTVAAHQVLVKFVINCQIEAVIVRLSFFYPLAKLHKLEFGHLGGEVVSLWFLCRRAAQMCCPHPVSIANAVSIRKPKKKVKRNTIGERMTNQVEEILTISAGVI